MTRAIADVAVIGGTGFYELLDDSDEHAVQTPYGAPSAPGVGQEEVFALFAANLTRLRRLLSDAVAALSDPDGCACSTWADGVTLTYGVP